LFYNYIPRDGKYNDGEYKEWYDDGRLKYEYMYKNNKKEGNYKRWHRNGQLAEECVYKNNKLEGVENFLQNVYTKTGK
tara:strand:- start:93 stop:326 length:234 start_codon:yes stop_codon:yes gene_type:complete